MEVLLFNQRPKKTKGLPSWVADWATDLVLPVSWAALHEPIFTAGGTRDTSLARADISKGVISVRGAMIGFISTVGQATYEIEARPLLREEIEFGSAKLVFDEVDKFVQNVHSHRAATTPDTQHLSERAMLHASLRICDSGRSSRYFAAQFDSYEAGMARLQALRSSVAYQGGRILRDNATKRAYSLFNIYATEGITPWYVDYYRSTTILHRLARGPIPVARTIVLALVALVDDVVGICKAWAYFWFHTARAHVKRRFARNVTLRVSDEDLQKVGLDPSVARGEDMPAFRTNLLLNAGRRVFRTKGGHVGMGPGDMQAGDAVVVLYGLSTPLVLREETKSDEWTLVGEAYCDGVMDGEAVGVNEREFVLV
ncbi:hypothetical protein PWT90_09900 [Aphanocladium album]|nr:hypothetical protein PWT90_09900 [Aphanocladium album]